MMLVEDLMTREVVTLNPDDDLTLADTILRLGRIRHLPVVDASQRLLGLVTHRDLLRLFANSNREPARLVTAQEVMTREVFTVAPTTGLREALATMLLHKFGCLPVVTLDRTLIGLITEADLVRFAAEIILQLEELERLMAR